MDLDEGSFDGMRVEPQQGWAMSSAALQSSDSSEQRSSSEPPAASSSYTRPSLKLRLLPPDPDSRRQSRRRRRPTEKLLYPADDDGDLASRVLRHRRVRDGTPYPQSDVSEESHSSDPSFSPLTPTSPHLPLPVPPSSRLAHAAQTRLIRLQNDPYVKKGSIQPHNVVCAACNKLIQTDKRQAYSYYHWDKHRKRCWAIKAGNKGSDAEQNHATSAENPAEPVVKKKDEENEDGAWVGLNPDEIEELNSELRAYSTVDTYSKGDAEQLCCSRQELPPSNRGSPRYWPSQLFAFGKLQMDEGSDDELPTDDFALTTPVRW